MRPSTGGSDRRRPPTSTPATPRPAPARDRRQAGRTEIAAESLFVNVAADGTRAYFTSEAALTGAEENEAGEIAEGSATKGTGTLTKESNLITGVATAEGAFLPGMEISGATWGASGNIAQGTTIVAVEAGTLTLSEPAKASASAEELSAGFPNLYLWEDGALSFVAVLDPVTWTASASPADVK